MMLFLLNVQLRNKYDDDDDNVRTGAVLARDPVNQLGFLAPVLTLGKQTNPRLLS